MKILCCAGAPDPYFEGVKDLTFDLVLGVDAGASRLVSAGYQVDIAIGDFDSGPQIVARHLIKLPPEKDDTDLEYSLQYLEEHYGDTIEEVTILGALKGGRLDHLLSTVHLAYQPRFKGLLGKLFFVDRANTLRFLVPGSYVLRRDVTKRYLSVIGLTAVHDLTIHQAKYSIYNYEMVYPQALISNEFVGDKPIELSFGAGLVALMQTRDEAG